MKFIEIFSKGKYSDEEKLLRDLIKQRDVSVIYQPIYNLDSCSILGHEALCRGPQNSVLSSPDKLFTSADKHGLLYPLESLVREMSIRQFREFHLTSKLFLNLTPKIISEPGFAKGQTHRLVNHLGLHPSQIVFEITERHSISDFSVFRKALEHYREQGFQVAVDDAGAGYSSLQAIAEIHPDYIKLDMSLIRGIDTNTTKKALLETFVTFSQKINSSLIAEGIETEQELCEIRKLGITFGQGYLLSKPLPGPPWPAFNRTLNTTLTNSDFSIAPLLTTVPMLPKTTLIEKIVHLFQTESNIPAVIIAEQNRPIGLITRVRLVEHRTNKNADLQFMNEPASTIMDTTNIVVKSEFSVSVMCQLVTYKTNSRLSDLIIVTHNSQIAGVIPIYLLFSKYINLSM